MAFITAASSEGETRLPLSRLPQMRRPDDLVRLLSGIYFYMVFLHFDFCRGKTVPAVHFIRELFPSFPPKTRCQFLFCHEVFHYNHRQPGQILFPLPLLFFRFPAGTDASSSSAASAATAPDSLKNTIFPSTSIKEICSVGSCASDDLPKRSLFKSAICSNTS